MQFQKSQKVNAMNHFVEKYFNKIAGAGGKKKPDPPDPPPPPSLKPPILGDLQAIASFDYVESLDLISDGPIDGFVSPDGRYVEDAGIFESIYLNDAQIKQTSSPNLGDNVYDSFSLSQIGDAISGYFYEDGVFQEKLSTSLVNNLSGSITLTSQKFTQILDANNGFVNYSFIDGKDNIANSIYQSILSVPQVLFNTSDASFTFQQKLINQAASAVRLGKFNYASAKEVSAFLLADFPNKEVDEYPFICLKLNISALTNEMSYVFEPGDYLYLEDDVYNQVYLPLEIEELNKKIFLESKRKINITYPVNSGYDGDIYLFIYKDADNFVLQNGIDAIIKNIKNIKIIKPRGKFNISNASCELKYGEQLQKPPSLFQKTYAEKSYNTKLIGPFAVGKNVLRTPTMPNGSTVNLSFNENDVLLQKGLTNSVTETLITPEIYNLIKAKHSYFWTFDGHLEAAKPILLNEKQRVTSGQSIINLVKFSRLSTSRFLANGNLDPLYDIIQADFEQIVSGKTQRDRAKRFSAKYITEQRAFSVRFNIAENALRFEPINVNSFTVPPAAPSSEFYLRTQFVNGFYAFGSVKPLQVMHKYLIPDKAQNGIKSKNDFQLEVSSTYDTARAFPNGAISDYGVRAYRGIDSPDGDITINNFYKPLNVEYSDLEDKSSGRGFGDLDMWFSWVNLAIKESDNGDYAFADTAVLFSRQKFIHQPKAAIAAMFDLMLDFEGSEDNRATVTASDVTNIDGKIGFSSWAKNSVSYTSEKSRPITHVIENPNVDAVFVTLNVRALKDTAHLDTILYESTAATPMGYKDKKFPLGSSIPSIMRFSIECGYQDSDGNEVFVDSSYPRFYEIKGIAESPAAIDVGRTENSNYLTKYSRFILGTKSIAEEITLPPAQPNRIRFVRVTRTTFESYSSLIRRELFLDKITEIINSPFSYPFSCVCGLKLDARSISEIPSRSYDARFKKVFVPSNYYPLKASGQDKRYLTAAEYNSATTEEKRIYEGNWDGTFKFAWSDNPVWVLFDILINRRYGLGNFIEPTQINYWELYKIGRYCDAVNDDGVFVGVPSADGGYEPRYAFNGVIADKTNVFDMIKTIVSSFRGNLFYTNSEINFTNDRLKPVISFFTNANVKDGIFTYSNDRRDLQYNVMEVSFLDRTDLFKEKIEYVEDSVDIKNRGILRNSAQTFGVTSRAHAQRIGRHMIYSTINEDQNVQFIAGLETLLCRPGDLIAINDEMVSFKNHAGRVLEVDVGTKSIFTNISLNSSDFSSSGVTGQITILIPTGKNTQKEFYDLAKSPSKLNIGELYKNDVPMAVTFQAILTGISDFGSTFYFDPSQESYSLINDIQQGAPCTITLANTKQEIYKVASIRELNLNEYEVTATKFDTGKFAEIEAGENLNDFFQYFPASRTGQVNEGSSETIQNKYQYDLSYPQITTFTTGNLDLDNDLADFTGAWSGVEGANCYDVELITPRYKSYKIRTTDTGVNFEDFGEVGRFTFKVTARNTGVYPNLISPTAVSGFRVVSYVAPVPGRLNGIVSNLKINSTL